MQKSPSKWQIVLEVSLSSYSAAPKSAVFKAEIGKAWALLHVLSHKWGKHLKKKKDLYIFLGPNNTFIILWKNYMLQQNQNFLGMMAVCKYW